MKKLSMTITVLTGLFILTSCGTSNGEEEASSQSSVAQNVSSSSSSSEESAESTSSSIDSIEKNDSSNSIISEEPAESTSSIINSDEQSDTSNSISSNEPAESTSSTSENIINSEEEAFTFIKEQTGIEADNTDIVYGLLDSDENSYTLRLVSQSIRDQGGSGTVGLYTIYKDGTYETGQK